MSPSTTIAGCGEMIAGLAGHRGLLHRGKRLPISFCTSDRICVRLAERNEGS